MKHEYELQPSGLLGPWTEEGKGARERRGREVLRPYGLFCAAVNEH